MSPHQDTEYYYLEAHGEQFYFTNEQVEVARKRAENFNPV